MQHQQMPMGPGQQLHVMQASAGRSDALAVGDTDLGMRLCSKHLQQCGRRCVALTSAPSLALTADCDMCCPLPSPPVPSRQFQLDMPPGGPAAAGPAMLNQMMQLVMEQLLEPNGPAAGLAAGLGGPGGGLGAGFPPPHFPFMFDLNELGELFFDDEEEGEEEDMLEEEEELSDSDVEGAAGDAEVQ